MFRKKKHDNEIFSILSNWKGAFDCPSYAQAVNEYLPHLKNDEIVFLWKRAVQEIQSGEYERQWFGEIVLGNIVSYLPENCREQRILELKLDSFVNEKVKAILLLQLSNFSNEKIRIALQKEAWECSAFHCNDPINNPSDNHAIALQWTNEKVEKTQLVWIDTIIDLFDGKVINDIWTDYIAKAKSGAIDQNCEFAYQIYHLARKITQEKIPQACYECFDVYKSAGRIEEMGKTVSLLITRLPETQQAKTWKSVIEFGLTQQASFVPWFDPKKFAKYLEKLMPNSV